MEKAMVEGGQVLSCNACGNHVKPDITFFGEELPSSFIENYEEDAENADLLLVIGTSLNVAPVSFIPTFVDCPRIVFNRVAVKMEGGTQPDDAFVEGNCDATLKMLADELQWQIE